MFTRIPSSTPTAVQNGQAAFTHGMADVEPGVRIHYVLAGDGPRTIVLLHGFAQTWRWDAGHSRTGSPLIRCAAKTLGGADVRDRGVPYPWRPDSAAGAPPPRL